MIAMCMHVVIGDQLLLIIMLMFFIFHKIVYISVYVHIISTN